MNQSERHRDKFNRMPPTDGPEPLSKTEYDAIILGTGVCESILAASLSLAGASVLHLDPNPFYGSTW